MGDYEESTSRTYESPASVRSGRRHRKRRRGYVIPLDFDADAPPAVSGHSRRRRRSRRRGVGSVEIFIALSAFWMVLVVGAVMLEAVSEQHWFFIEKPKVEAPPKHYVIFGEEEIRPDAVFLPLGSDPQKEKQMVVSGALGLEPEMNWWRVALVFISVPLAYVLYRLGRRLRRLGRR